MNFDTDKAFDLIEELIILYADTKLCMTKLIDYCEAIQPNQVWNEFRELDFEGDTKKLKNWLENVLSSEPPFENINGYRFGIFNPVLDNGAASCGLYISGSTQYGADNPDWAVLKEDSYLPENSESNSEVLHRIYRLLEEHNLLGDAEYILCLGYACFVVNSICRVVNPELLYVKNKARAIVVGFDSGDWVVVREN